MDQQFYTFTFGVGPLGAMHRIVSDKMSPARRTLKAAAAEMGHAGRVQSQTEHAEERDRKGRKYMNPEVLRPLPGLSVHMQFREGVV